MAVLCHFCVTKPDKIDLIFQLILANCILQTLEILSPALGNIIGVLCSTPVLAVLIHVWLFLAIFG